MERWYIAFNTVGSPQEILFKLEQGIKQHRLGEFVVRFCYEKGVRKGQFYVFLGVASEQLGQIPEEIYNEFYSMLQRLRLSDKNLYVYFDEVKQMVTKELEIHNLRQIKMWKSEKVKQSDPFSYANTETASNANANLRDGYNKLLYWLSAYGRGTWQQFVGTCKELGIDTTGEYSRRIMRRLRSLGHIELTNNGQTWFIAPPCLVETESDNGLYHAFLAGQRSAILIQNLQDAAYQIETDPQPNGDAPDAIRVAFENRQNAEQFIEDFSRQHHALFLAGQASIKIASLLPDLEGWEQDLPILSVVIGNYTYERWSNNGFSRIELPKETGLYRLTHTSTRFDHPQLTLFYNADDGTWRKGDWYGLRYLMLRRTGEKCTFHYDHNLKRLNISSNARIPDMYERSLILESGRLPIFKSEQVIFGDISETLAHMLANKLEAEFIEYKGL
jgi:hypothetical protein